MIKKLTVTLFVVILLFTLCKKASEIQQEDKKRLDVMYKEIQNLSNSKSCTDPLEWSFISVGTESGNFLTYHSSIKDEFLKKVQEFNKKQKDYDKKWDIMHTLILKPSPKSVECVDGKPKLIY